MVLLPSIPPEAACVNTFFRQGMLNPFPNWRRDKPGYLGRSRIPRGEGQDSARKRLPPQFDKEAGFLAVDDPFGRIC